MNEGMQIAEKLGFVQSRIVVPKGKWNDFSKFNYRNAEDILSAATPLLLDIKAIITLSDELIMVGERYYVKATASFSDSTGSIDAVSLAREPEKKKGMDESQITGSASSYARKNALSGLLAIDGEEADPDEDNNTGHSATFLAKITSEIWEVFDRHHITTVCKDFGIQKLSDMAEADFESFKQQCEGLSKQGDGTL